MSWVSWWMVCLAAGPAAARDSDEQKLEQDMARAREDMERAREKLQEAMTQMRTLARERSRESRESRRFSWHWSDRGPRLGVLVRDTTSADPKGVSVEGVTPGSPADKAGLKAGDILTSIDGQSLAWEADGGSGRAVARLLEVLHREDRGDQTVKVEYRRGQNVHGSAVVKLEESPDFSWSMERPEADPPDVVRVEGPHVFLTHSLSERWRDMDLAELNPELGEFFGAKQGVLVLKAPPEGGLPLKAGDVIVKIGERQPSTPSQAVRILRSYEPGETLKLEVLRKKDKQTLSFKMPER